MLKQIYLYFICTSRSWDESTRGQKKHLVEPLTNNEVDWQLVSFMFRYENRILEKQSLTEVRVGRAY